MSALHPIFTIAIALFFLMDSIGNVPIFISLLKKFPPERQRVIIIREMLIALVVILLFYFGGSYFLTGLGISESSVRLSGGIILFLIALKLVFPPSSEEKEQTVKTQAAEPFIVPLAIPLVAGPAILAAVMIYSTQGVPILFAVSGIVLAWISSTLILIVSPFLQRVFGPRGLAALERLMGLVLILIAVQMFLDGLHIFLKNCY